MLAKAIKHIRPSLALLVIAALLISVIPVSAGASPAQRIYNPVAAPAALPPPPVAFDLCAEDSAATVESDDLVLPDLTAVRIWGFSLGGGDCTAAAEIPTLPGPVLVVDEGTAVTVNLYNHLADNLSLAFPGQTMVPDLIGAPPCAAVACPLGVPSKTYTFIAANPGTYLYEAGTFCDAASCPSSANPTASATVQVPMGLYGALIVRPDPTGSFASGHAYNDASSAYVVEETLVLSEIDPALNNYPGDPADFFDFPTPTYPDTTPAYAPTYWLINGKGYPGTAPIAATAAGDKVLIRYLNAGLLHHTMQLLGLHQRVLAKDAELLPVPFDAIAETIPAGQTMDVIVTVGASGSSYPLYNRQLHVTNGTAASSPHAPGGMLTFITVP
jgi:FtsP/CotA-like multicopper oxidase with cupredoxin domain